MSSFSIALLLLHSASCYYVVVDSGPPTIRNTSSLSSDVVEVSMTGSTSSIKVKSSSIGNSEDTIEVEYFRGGGGNSTVKLNRPTITSSSVYNSLFSLDAFPRVFVRKNETEEARFNASDALYKLHLVVRDAGKPFVVNNGSIAYFWGVDKLPIESLKFVGNGRDPWMAPFETYPSNDKRLVSYCDITGMERCSAPIVDFSHLAPFLFVSTEGKQLTDLAWLCPQDKVCCGWECCDEKEPFPWKYVLYIVLVIAGVSTVSAAIFQLSKSWKSCQSRRRSTRNAHQRLPSESGSSISFQSPTASVDVETRT